jgi:hypothetical protein
MSKKKFARRKTYTLQYLIKSSDFGIFDVRNRSARGNDWDNYKDIANTPCRKNIGNPPCLDDIAIIEHQCTPRCTSTIVDYYTKQEKYGPVSLGFKSEIYGKGQKYDKLDEHLKETDNPVFFRTRFN